MESKFDVAYVRLFVVLMQLAVVSRAPMPWAHDHADLSQEQLSTHMQLCHPDSTHEELPHGRHVHFTALEAIVDGSSEGRTSSDFAPAERLVFESDLALSQIDGESAACANGSPLGASVGRNLSHFAPISGCELFQAFGASRI